MVSEGTGVGRVHGLGILVSSQVDTLEEDSLLLCLQLTLGHGAVGHHVAEPGHSSQTLLPRH